MNEIEDANWDYLKTNAAIWTNLAHMWEAAFTEVRDASMRPGGTEWTGAGAEAFRHRAATDVVQIHGPADMLLNAAGIATRGHETQVANRWLVISAVFEVERQDFRVGDDYSVTDTYTYYSSAAEQAQREQTAQDQLHQIPGSESGQQRSRDRPQPGHRYRGTARVRIPRRGRRRRRGREQWAAPRDAGGRSLEDRLRSDP
ncbi:hypothetical protein [[Mycobacterium] vasticus]|uniref:SnoaL-like domain-containing protein n=1 Tax=[Mycobacterium] vasticus TaxID=2875777 RepID=A0ABU5YZ10_9MYCO|nr:hypothetical protein [Mycolicibacter sp. MYC017]MEB3070376.1 hypothetical protein [Mycolicibacter sp. MYC017]